MSSDLEKKITAYLGGEMTPKEQEAFKERINNEPEVKRLFVLSQEMDTIFDDSDWEITNASSKHPKIQQYETYLKSPKGKSITTTIQDVENDYFSDKPKNRIKQLIIYAGSIAAILVLGLFVITKSTKNIDSEHLYVAYKNWNELPSLTLRDGDSEIAKAEKFFRQKEYSKALVIFQNYQIENKENLNSQVLMYTGITQLELDQNEKALLSFKKLAQSNSLDAPKAHWYLALTYLKMKNIEEAKKELQKLITASNGYKKQSTDELIKILE